MDESLIFANATAVQERIEALLAENPSVKQVLLICSAVNQIDATALGVLTRMELDLSTRGIGLALAEVKGPVMDRLRKTELGLRVRDRVFLSAHAAVQGFAATQLDATNRDRAILHAEVG